jgi:hypothetical protein
LTSSIHNINTQQIVDRINVVIDREIFNSYEESHRETYQTTPPSIIEDITPDEFITVDNSITEDENKDNDTT